VITPTVEAPAGPVPAEVATALVLGGTGGIGRAACIALAQRGFDVIVHSHRQRTDAEALCQEIRALGRKALAVQGDILNETFFRDALEEIARHNITLTGVVHCAVGGLYYSTATDLSWEEVSAEIDMHLKSAFFVMKYFVPLMVPRKYGKLVFLATQAIEAPAPKLAHYITAKAALSGFAKAIAVDLAPAGIRVNLVSPGMTRTPLISSIPQKVQMLIEASAPLRRLATPEDIAHAIAFLMSRDSDYLAGETIRVNGGQVML
jgi:3-oxoacyl-[acyl-carrier protein] reductase